MQAFVLTGFDAIAQHAALAPLRTIVVLKIDENKIAGLSLEGATQMLSQSSTSMVKMSVVKDYVGNKGSQLGASWKVWAKVGHLAPDFIRLSRAPKLIDMLQRTLPHVWRRPAADTRSPLPPSTASLPPAATASIPPDDNIPPAASAIIAMHHHPDAALPSDVTPHQQSSGRLQQQKTTTAADDATVATTASAVIVIPKPPPANSPATQETPATKLLSAPRSATRMPLAKDDDAVTLTTLSTPGATPSTTVTTAHPPPAATAAFHHHQQQGMFAAADGFYEGKQLQLAQEFQQPQEQQSAIMAQQGGRKRRADCDPSEAEHQQKVHNAGLHDEAQPSGSSSQCFQTLCAFAPCALDGAIAAGTLLGQGTEGKVMCIRLPNGEQVACKVPQNKLAGGYLDDERTISGSIQHNNVIRLIGFGHMKPDKDV